MVTRDATHAALSVTAPATAANSGALLQHRSDDQYEHEADRKRRQPKSDGIHEIILPVTVEHRGHLGHGEHDFPADVTGFAEVVRALGFR